MLYTTILLSLHRKSIVNTMQVAELQTTKLRKIIDISKKKLKKMCDNMKFSIVKKVDCPKTLLTLPPGSAVKIATKDFVSYNTAHSAISRLNKTSGFREFFITTPDNGTTLLIERKKKKQ